MNISIEEQIEYMRKDVVFYRGVLLRHDTSPSIWQSELEHCQAILATLETVRDERNAKVTP
jgi:hypothetical protein